MNFKLKISLAAFSLVAFAGVVSAQQGLWPNFPIVGGAAYCSSTTNAVCTNTVPAGPTVLTGNESIPANTNLSQGRSPQNVLLKPANLNAAPITISAANLTTNSVSASNISGGIFLTAASTITAANITLPASPINGQQYVVGSNRTITALSVTAAAGDTMGGNVAPTVLTASTTVPQGYRFICSLSGTVCTWFRLQ